MDSIVLGITRCGGCGELAIVGLNEAPLCADCFDGQLEQHRKQINAVLEAMERTHYDTIRSKLFCGEDEP